MTETQAAVISERMLTLDEMPWVDPPTLPPSDLPDSDGEPMESPWHVGSGPLLKESYVASRGGSMLDYYVGVNMFVYYSWQQVRHQDFKGPDVYFVHNADGHKQRRYWAIWDEAGRYPDVIIELLSASTEREDLTHKRQIYEDTFHVAEYFCIAPQVTRIMGWRANNRRYETLNMDERGWMWSETLGLWIGAWQGNYLAEENIWPRFYYQDGRLVLLAVEQERERAAAAEAQIEQERERAAAAEAQIEQERERAAAAEAQIEQERERAETERERAELAEARIAQLEEQLRRLKAT